MLRLRYRLGGVVTCRRQRASVRLRGFSLVELLVVIGIVSLLLAILLPSLAHARAMAKQAVYLSNLRQIGLATQYYVNQYKAYPMAYAGSTCRWMDLIKPTLSKSSDVYCCPADPKQITVTWDPTITLSYGINTFNFGGPAYCFWYCVKAINVARPEATILFGDCTPGKYFTGGGSAFSDPVPNVDYRHPNQSFGVVFCDSHAESRTRTTLRDWDASH
jgi:prepilin-type N-terminal cleavage/methylation domain-containing protein